VVDPEVARTVEECVARIRQLEEENAQLREAAKTFGDLAERLKRALDAELRAGQAARQRDRSVIAVDAGQAGLAK
jgi:proteasome assembly chaperone (PAC2) family protein